MIKLRIALRYLFAKKSHKVVNVISLISMAGVAVATMAIVIVLSVFNGFSDLARKQLSTFDPDIKISSTIGKTFNGDSLAMIVVGCQGVQAVMPVLQERALLVSGDRQKPVIVKGLSPDDAAEVLDLDNLMIDGVYATDNGLPDSIAGVQLSVGVAIDMGLHPSPYATTDIYMPRRVGRINPANPAAAYRSIPVAVTGVFQVNQPEYDNDYLFAPIDDVRRLLEYDGGEATALEIKTVDGADISSNIAKLVGPNFTVLNRERQQAETFRMISVEKWVTFLMLIFILLIACFNIVSTLSLIILEKRPDMATLRALGATKRDVTSIFITEGWLITAVGGLSGTVLGIVAVLIQQWFGVIKLGADPSALTIDVYPVHLLWSDVAVTLALIMVTGLVISQLARVFVKGEKSAVLPALIVAMTLSMTACHSSKKAAEYKVPEISFEMPVKAEKPKTASKIEAEARRWLGTPYKFGGSSRNGTDCSGMVMVIYRDVAGIKLPRNSAEQQKFAKPVRPEKLAQGDLVFFTTTKNGSRVGHVGIYLGKGNFIHSSSSKGVIISNLKEKYYQTHFHSAGRVL